MSKRLLLVGNFLSRHNRARAISEDLADLLRGRGWQVTMTSHQLNPLLRLLDMAAVVITQVRHYDCAVVDVFSGNAFTWAEVVCALLKRLGKPFVLTLRGGRLPEFYRQDPRRVSRLLRSAARVVTPSHYLQQAFQSIRVDVLYLPNGIDLARYPYRPRASARPEIIWLRAFHAIYQPWLAIEVLAEVRQKYSGARLTMVGPDKHDGSLARTLAAAQNLDVNGGLRIDGGVPKSQVPGWLAQGEVFLNTTIYESFGVSVLEAAAVGLPIVTTSAGELPFFWKHGQDALICPVDDPHALSQAVIQVLDQPGFARQLSASARRKAEQFDWPAVLPQWESLFQEAAGGG